MKSGGRRELMSSEIEIIYDHLNETFKLSGVGPKTPRAVINMINQVAHFMRGRDVKIEELETALDKYGHHTPDCGCWDHMDNGKPFPRYDWTCTCGWRLAVIKRTREGTDG
jgi:hypothetical protein